MTAVRFNGHDTLTYPDHLDASTGKTLVAVPGQSYTTAVAPGRNAGLPAIPGDGRWSTPSPFPASPRLPELPPAPQGASTVTTPAAPEGAPASPESED